MAPPMTRRVPSTGRYELQASDITRKHTDVDIAMFTKFIPINNKLRKMEYLETEHTLPLKQHSYYLRNVSSQTSLKTLIQLIFG